MGSLVFPYHSALSLYRKYKNLELFNLVKVNSFYLSKTKYNTLISIPDNEFNLQEFHLWFVGFSDAVLRVGPLDPHPQNQGEGSF